MVLSYYALTTDKIMQCIDWTGRGGDGRRGPRWCMPNYSLIGIEVAIHIEKQVIPEVGSLTH